MILLILIVAPLYLTTANYGVAQTNDTRAAAVASWNLAVNRTLALPEDWAFNYSYWPAQGRNDRLFVNRFPGVAYWAAPAYWLSETYRPTTAAVDHPFLVPMSPASAVAALTTAAASALLLILLLDLGSTRAAFLGALVGALGTSLWSVAADALWPHGPSVLALLAMIVLWRRRRFWPAAVFAALAVLVRPHLAAAIVPVALWAWQREGGRGGLALLTGTGAGLIAASGYTFWVFGSFLPIAGYDAGGHLGGLVVHSPWFTLKSAGLAFLSPSRGVIVFSPFLVIALAAVIFERRSIPGWMLALLLGAGLYLLVQLRAVGHTGGTGFFAYRVTLEPLILAAPALFVATARVMERRPRVAAVLWPLCSIAILIHAYGAVTGGMPAETVDAWNEIVQGLSDREG